MVQLDGGKTNLNYFYFESYGFLALIIYDHPGCTFAVFSPKTITLHFRIKVEHNVTWKEDIIVIDYTHAGC